MISFYKDLSNLLEVVSVQFCISCTLIFLMSRVTLRLAEFLVK